MSNVSAPLRFIDLFCGIGGFRFALERAAANLGLKTESVFSSDINAECCKAYSANFGETPSGDITQVAAADIPAHDLLLAGFPCQPFSVIGKGHGFEDTRGTLFFDIARILQEKRPACFVLENVKRLAVHDGGRTLSRIMETLAALGYSAEHRVLNALDFGLPHKRERIFIVGFAQPTAFTWPAGGLPMLPLDELLEREVDKKHYASPAIRASRREKIKRQPKGTAIWHENKSGNVAAHLYSGALRAGASYNYLLVNGERRLTPREMLRLQGFPESFRIVCSDHQARRQAGNSLPVNVATAVIGKALDALRRP